MYKPPYMLGRILILLLIALAFTVAPYLIGQLVPIAAVKNDPLGIVWLDGLLVIGMTVSAFALLWIMYLYIKGDL